MSGKFTKKQVCVFSVMNVWNVLLHKLKRLKVKRF